MSELSASAGIAIFVKTPGISALKTRLAAAEGVVYAENWYQLAASAVAEVATLSGAAVYWAVAEPEAMKASIWQGLPRLAQLDQAQNSSQNSSQNTSLGARMHCVHQQLLARHSSAILLGADTPQLDIAVLCAVIDYLRTSEPCWAVAPATDGGFWLHGANICAPLAAWEAVRYSSADTLAQFEQVMAGQGQLVRFQSETDVDTAADLAVCASALTALARPSGKQRALLDWMHAQAFHMGSHAVKYPA